MSTAMELSIALSCPVALAKSQRWITISSMGIIMKWPAGISPKGVGTMVERSMPLAADITLSVIDFKAASPPS